MIITDPKFAGGGSEIAVVIAGAGDAEGLAEASRASGEFGPILRATQVNPSGTGHFFEARQRLQGAEEDASGLPLWFARDVEAVMISIDEINVGMTGRAEDYGVAQGTTGGGMGSWVFDAQVGFDLYDASGEV